MSSGRAIAFLVTTLVFTYFVQGANQRSIKAYLHENPDDTFMDWFKPFFSEPFKTPGMRWFVAYMVLNLLSCVTMMKVESIRHDVSHLWFYTNGCHSIASSITWPMFIWRMLSNPLANLEPADTSNRRGRFVSLFVYIFSILMVYSTLNTFGDRSPWYYGSIGHVIAMIAVFLVSPLGNNTRKFSANDHRAVIALYAICAGGSLVYLTERTVAIIATRPEGTSMLLHFVETLSVVATADGHQSIGYDALGMVVTATLFVALDPTTRLHPVFRFIWTAATAVLSPVVFPLYMIGRELTIIANNEREHAD